MGPALSINTTSRPNNWIDDATETESDHDNEDLEYEKMEKSQEMKYTKLQRACIDGSINTASDLLDRGAANANAQGSAGITPLSIAAFRGDDRMIELLMSHSARLNELNKSDGMTPLVSAIAGGNEETAKTLMSRWRADVNLHSEKQYSLPCRFGFRFYRNSALSAAIKTGQLNICQLLLDSGAQICDDGDLLLSQAIESDQASRVEFLINNAGVKVGLGSHLVEACRCRNVRIIELLLDNGADVNRRCERSGKTPLQALRMRNAYMYFENKDKLRNLLISRGANTEMKDICDYIRRKHSFEWQRVITASPAQRIDDESETESNRFEDTHDANERDEAIIDTESQKACIDDFVDTDFARLGDKAIKYTKLQRACIDGSLDRAFARLDRGANANAQGDAGITPLSIAAFRGDDRMIELLLKHSARLDELNKGNKMTPLMSAIAGGNEDTVKTLIRRWRVGYPNCTLLFAVKTGQLNICQLLLDYGAQIDDDSLLQQAIESNRADMVEFLISAGVKVDPGKHLVEACRRQNLRIVELLLDNGADLNQHHGKGRGTTALFTAIEQGNIKIVNLLISRGADIGEQYDSSFGNMNAFVIACGHGHGQLAESLVENGATPDIHALIFACVGGHFAIAKWLIEMGINIDESAAVMGETALIFACSRGDQKVASFLLENGACPNKRNLNGITPLMIACMHGGYMSPCTTLPPFYYNMGFPFTVPDFQQSFTKVASILVKGGAMVDLRNGDSFVCRCSQKHPWCEASS